MRAACSVFVHFISSKLSKNQFEMKKAPSGAQKRKIVRVKESKFQDSLRKTPKITDMFSAQSSSSERSTSDRMQTDTEEETQSVVSERELASSTTQSGSEYDFDYDDAKDFELQALNASTSTRFENFPSQTAIESDVIPFRFSTDAALWDIENELPALQKYWAQLGII